MREREKESQHCVYSVRAAPSPSVPLVRCCQLAGIVSFRGLRDVFTVKRSALFSRRRTTDHLWIKHCGRYRDVFLFTPSVDEDSVGTVALFLIPLRSRWPPLVTLTELFSLLFIPPKPEIWNTSLSASQNVLIKTYHTQSIYNSRRNSFQELDLAW